MTSLPSTDALRDGDPDAFGFKLGQMILAGTTVAQTLTAMLTDLHGQRIATEEEVLAAFELSETFVHLARDFAAVAGELRPTD